MDEPSTSTVRPSMETSKAKMIVADEILHKQQCSECCNYLSVGPVMLNMQNKIICGRCVQFYPNKQVLKKSMYDCVAQGLIFKCIYHYQGCRALVPFVNVLETNADELHEHSCPFKGRNDNLECINCSFLAENAVQLVAHLEVHHPDALIKNNFEYSLGDQFNAILLDGDYIFHISILFADNEFEISMSPYVTAAPDEELENYSLKVITAHSNIQYVLINSGKFFELLTIDVSDLKCILDNSRRVTFEAAFNRKKMLENVLYEGKIQAAITQKTAQNYSRIQKGLRQLVAFLPGLLRCNACDTYDKTLYLCGRGHALCRNCAKCSICGYGKRPDFELSEQTPHFSQILCEWEGCGKLSCIADFIIHKLTCKFRQYTCPVGDCDYASRRGTFGRHFFGHAVHDDNISVIMETVIRIQKNVRFYWVLSKDWSDIVVVSVIGNGRDTTVEINSESPLLHHKYSFLIAHTLLKDMHYSDGTDDQFTLWQCTKAGQSISFKLTNTPFYQNFVTLKALLSIRQ